MIKSINKSLSNLALCMIFYLILLLFEGKYRIDFLNSHIDSKYINIIKISSNINMVMTSLFAVFILVLILIVCYFVIEIFNFKTSMNSVIEAFIMLTLIFTAFQLIKLILDFTLLQSPIINLINAEEFFSNMKKTKWFQYTTFTNYLMILVGAILFSLEMDIQENKRNHLEIFTLSSIFITCYIIILV
jgi:hypothetical protein